MVLSKQKCDAMLRSLSMPKTDTVSIQRNSSRTIEDQTVMQLTKNLSKNTETLGADYKMVSKPLKNLSDRMNKLRDKAYKIIDKMNLLPNLNGDVDDFNKEFELLQEMERINKELGNVNLLMNAAAHCTQNKENNSNELTSQTDSQLTISELLRLNDDEPKDYKENKVLTKKCDLLPSKLDYVTITDCSSCGRLCEDILMESQKEPSSRCCSSRKINETSSHGNNSSQQKCKLSYTHNPIKSLIRTFSSKNLKKDADSKNASKIFAKAEILENSSSLRDCQRYSSELNFSISGLLEESCDVDNIVKENEFLQKQLTAFQNDLEKAKKETIVYKSLLAKEKAKPKPKPRPAKKLSANLCKIKNILDSSAALPAFPETIEVLKTLCLLLLKKINDTENHDQSEQTNAKAAKKLEDAATSTPDVRKQNVESNNVLVVNSSTKVMLQNSTEILKAIEDLAKRTATRAAKVKEAAANQIEDTKATTSNVDTQRKLAPPVEIDFQQFAENLKEQQNMKVFVQHMPKKSNDTTKPTCQSSSSAGCDKIYLVFVK